MFGLSYLSSDKKKLLERLQQKLTRAQSPHGRKELELQIQELVVQAKPYTQCDLMEADELRSQLLQKINILSGLGKAKAAEPFQMHLKDVEFHIQTIHMAEALKEQEKIRSDEGGNLRERSESVETLKKKMKTKQAFGKHRWVVGFEDEPTDNRN